MKANQDIRREMRVQDVKQWEVAHELQINEMTLYRWLRVELDEPKKQRILKAIEDAAAKKV